jgi:hypothetical protein
MEGASSRVDGYNFVGLHPERMVEFIQRHF